MATCSEDGTIKIWNIQLKCCIATLRGHASDVWCLALASFPKNSTIQMQRAAAAHTVPRHTHHPEEDLILFSGGNDGSVKAWPLSSQLIACSEEASASLRLFPIPHLPTKSDAQLSNSRRSNGVSAIHLSPDGLAGVVCLCDGGLWLVNFSPALSVLDGTGPLGGRTPSSPATSTPGWLYVCCLGKDITNADAIFETCLIARDGVDSRDRSASELNNINLTLFCAHPDGHISNVKISKRISLNDGHQAAEVSVATHSWAAHKLRTINVWCQVVRDVNSGEDVACVVSVSVRGVCRVWGPGLGGDSPYRLLFEGSTGKENVATCVLLQSRAFIVGDSKGGITIFNLPDSAADWGNFSASIDSAQIAPKSTFIPHAHGTELVSCLETNTETGGFYSTGHDGSFCVFTGSGEIVNRLKCLPIKTPDKIFIVGKGADVSYYIGGFLGGLFLLYDIRRGYQVLRLEGGGWKR